MKKISLKNLNLQEVDTLSRDQLKNILGGFSSLLTETSVDKPCNCNTKDDCPTTDPKKPQDCMNEDCKSGGGYRGGVCGWDGTSGS